MVKKPVKKPKTKKQAEEKEEEEKETKEKKAIITQVVEVIEIDESSETKENKEDAKEVPPKEELDVSELEEVGAEEWEKKKDDDERYEKKEDIGKEEKSEKEDKKEDQDKIEDEEVSQKEVVEELFSKHEPESLKEISMHKTKPIQNLLLWVIVVIVAAATTGVGLFLIRSSSVSPGFGLLTRSEPTPTPVLQVEPTPVVKLSREDISVQVLNGGGVAGAATKMKELLAELGYSVDNVGNTDEYSYEKTEIQTKSGKEQVLKLLTEDLEGDYSLGTLSATLNDDSDYDAVVIVGEE